PQRVSRLAQIAFSPLNFCRVVCWFIDQFADGLLPSDADALLEDGWDPNEIALENLEQFLRQELSDAKSANVRMKLNWLQSRRQEAAEYLRTHGKPRIFHLWEQANEK
ncbi:hypothetical protein, partial [Roseibacillus ishigakijimensis]|uniref:hypothetical protein n=1 Tax=Roseibacillus ishigakijimensis TaxID=454146 RepID=UPI0036400092